MLLEIRHLTQYAYSSPVYESVLELWAQPQKSSRQRLISFELEVDPAAQLFSYVDAYGNAVYHFDVPQPHERLVVHAKSAVETSVPQAPPAALDMGEWIGCGVNSSAATASTSSIRTGSRSRHRPCKPSCTPIRWTS